MSSETQSAEDSTPGTGNAATGPPPDEREYRGIDLDRRFELLKNGRRRRVLRLLRAEDGPVALKRVTEYVAAAENGVAPESLTSQERKRAYVGLYQCHLPKMDELGVVRFDRENNEVALGPNAAALEPYLHASPEPAPNWPAYYLALSLGGVVTLLGLTAIGLLAPALWTVLTGVLLGLFSVLSAAQLFV